MVILSITLLRLLRSLGEADDSCTGTKEGSLGEVGFFFAAVQERGCPADGVAAYFDVFFVVVMDGPSKDNRIGDSYSIFLPAALRAWLSI